MEPTVYRKRKTLLIYLPFQMKFIVNTVALSAVFLIFLLMINLSLLSAFKFSISWTNFLQAYALLSLVFLGIVGVCALKISHRIAGPIIRVINYINENENISKQDMKPLEFRKNDLFPELAMVLNFLLKKN